MFMRVQFTYFLQCTTLLFGTTNKDKCDFPLYLLLAFICRFYDRYAF